VNETAWLAQRAMLAIALMVGFYVLALAVALGLLWIPYAEWTYLDRIHPKIAFGCIASAAAILWSVLPRADRFEAPGPTLTDASHPELFRAIREVSSATQQEMPTDVFLVNDVNAWVTQRGGTMGFGSHRVMGLGLPLLQGLTVSEFKAVLAHEFGHYAAGDVKLGPWIYKTRTAIGRALATLGDSWLTGIFNAYGRMFLRLTHAVSREQEFLADALAARTVHPAAMASALRKTEGLAPAFASYWESEVSPALEAGCLPPITRGFEQFLATAGIAQAVAQLVNTSEVEGRTDTFDTHPPMRERLAALARVAAQQPPVSSDPPAASLLRNPEADARRLLEFAVGADVCAKLRPIEWQHLANEVYSQKWREAAVHFAKFLGRFTTDTLPAGKRAFSDAGRELSPSGEADLRIAFAVQALSVAVAVALLDSGAVADTSPGQQIVFKKVGASMEPFVAVRQLADGAISLDEWKAQCTAMGIAGVALGPAASV